jgi:ribosomal protein RSM22 (predicted rRNA methylase)
MNSSPSEPRIDIELSPADWSRLEEMRASFLQSGESGTPLPDYWQSARDLEIYDATFGARIGWKLNSVLDELQRRRIDVPEGTLVDWGAGTGVAARAFLARFGAQRSFRVHVHERSARARAFAEQRIASECNVAIEPAPVVAPDVLLVSHVIDELEEGGLDDLLALARRSAFVVWIESGSKRTSRALSAARERLLDAHDPLLPCMHRAACGVLLPDQSVNWCHHFAEPAPEAFTTAHWRAFSRTLHIDMRSLPYAYLVLRRRAATERDATSPETILREKSAIGDISASDGGKTVRILGTPRVEKGRALFDACSADGVRTLTVLERTDKTFFRALRDRSEPRVLRVQTEGDRVRSLRPD